MRAQGVLSLEMREYWPQGEQNPRTSPHRRRLDWLNRSLSSRITSDRLIIQTLELTALISSLGDLLAMSQAQPVQTVLHLSNGETSPGLEYLRRRPLWIGLTPTIMAALPSYSATPDVPAYSAEPTDTLPGYNESGTSAPLNSFVSSRGINDKLPNHFKINNNYVLPQLMPSDLEAHLVLLGAFHRLKEEVLSLKGVKADIPMEPEERWAVFLQRAVYRFEQWAIRMIGGEGEDDEESKESKPRVLKPNEVPPLDVMMVWHTYMLNPRTYHEDCIRKLPGLLRMG